MNTTTTKNERGSVLILFTMMLAIIVVLVGLVIDTTRMTTASQEESHTADLAAVSFLSAYLDNIFTARGFTADIQKAAYNNGLNAATRIGSLNTTSANKATSSDPENSQIVTEAAQLRSNTNWNQPGPRGHVEIGRWYSARPEGLLCGGFPGIDDKSQNNRCPCSVDTLPPPNEPFGCFVSCDNEKGCRDPFDPTNDNNRQPANAARVTLKTDEREGGNSIKNLFSGLTGINEVNISESAIVYVIPRHGVLLFDLGRSTVAETHYHWQKVGQVPLSPASSGDYAYLCQGTCQTNQAGLATCPINNQPPEVTYQLATSDSAITYAQGFNPGYAAAYQSLKSMPNYCADADKQCQRQYQCVEVDTTGDNTPDGERFLVDIGFESGAANANPKYAQPHSNMLYAARAFLDSLRENGRYGDTLGFIGYDSRVDTDPNQNFQRTNRYIPSTTVNLGAVSAAADWANSTNFRKIYDLLDPNPAQRRFRAAHNIFPRQTEFSNLPLALWHAHNMITRTPGSESGERYITLISPALTSCYYASENSKRNPSTATDLVCGRGFEAHQRSLEEAFNYRIRGTTLTTLQGNNVRLHVVPIGSLVQPHSIAVRKYDTQTNRFANSCYTNAELSAANLLTFIPDYIPDSPTAGQKEAYDAAAKAYFSIGRGLSPALRYNGANYWLNAAALQLSGIIVPVRMDKSMCNGLTGACFGDNDMRPEINLACSQTNPPPPPYTAALGYPAATPNINVDGNAAGSLNNGAGVPADRAGRLYCDPQCRERFGFDQGVTEQVRIDGFNPLFGVRPPSMALVGELKR